MNLNALTDKDIYEAIEAMQNGIAIKPDGAEAKNLQVSIDRAFAELDRRTEERNEKKSEAHQLKNKPEMRPPTKEELQAWQRGTESGDQEEVRDPSYISEYVRFEKQYFEQNPIGIKTIKAPVIDREPEYINIELTDQKGAKYIRTYNRAQVKALCRKYFSNVHSAWVGGNRKITNGFDNLLAFFLGWVEFDSKTPTLQDVLQDYFRYKKAKEGGEDSEAFKVAKELYNKIISVTSKNN